MQRRIRGILITVPLLFMLVLLSDPIVAFTIHAPRAIVIGSNSQTTTTTFSKTTLKASSNENNANKNAELNERRKTLLTRNGPYFELNRSTGKIAFGSTARLVTELPEGGTQDDIFAWLRDARQMALSIWDESLIEELPERPNVFRLQVMKLQFVTLQLQPWVDVAMWTQDLKIKNAQQGIPAFLLQSVDFDPNIQVLPGVGIDKDRLNIQIEVVGEMRPQRDGGQGVTGRIAFQTTGQLPPPLLILPDAILKAASDTINSTITNFAIRSFQRGAIQNYKKFLSSRKQQKQQQEA